MCPANQRSAALGASYAIAALSSVLAPYVTGRIIDMAPTRPAGFSLAFDVAGCLLLAGGLVSLLAIRPDRDASTLRSFSTTMSSAASIGSNATGPWPPGTTS